MTKKKNFHGTGGKGGLMRQRDFYCKKNPYDVMAQPLSKQKKAPADAGGGKVEQDMSRTVSTSIMNETEKKVKW